MDGFIDFSEALLAYRFGADPRKIVKDRYRGSYAIAVFTLFSLWVYSSLLQLFIISNLWGCGLAILFAEVWSPNAMLLVSRLCKEPPEGLGKLFRRGVRVSDIAIGIAISIGIACAFTSAIWKGLMLSLLSLLVLLLSVAISSALCIKTLGYANGDVLGFSFELSYAMLIAAYSLVARLWI